MSPRLSFITNQGMAVEECLNYDALPSLATTGTGTTLGKMPSGSMTVTIGGKFPCSFRTKTIEILYDIPSGIQLPYHEKPGNPFEGTTHIAYLPNNAEGRKLLIRLKHAWTHGLIFTIGTSLTSGKSDVVTWSSIPHKTSLNGGEYGWPDANYFAVANAAMDALLVPSDPKDCTTSGPQLVLGIPQHIVCNEKIVYTAPVSLATSASVAAALRPPSCTSSTGDCTICLDPLCQKNFVHIQGCNHAFHF